MAPDFYSLAENKIVKTTLTRYLCISEINAQIA
jgi:hypothetical protein